jgi:uncharacterized protein RhaS with RHS repeats
LIFPGDYRNKILLNVAQEQSESGAATANLLTGGLDETFERTDTTGRRTFITDVLGSTVALTDETGQVKTRYVYDAFGATTALGEANANPAQFTGRDNDATGLYYYRARYYSPTLHR